MPKRVWIIEHYANIAAGISRTLRECNFSVFHIDKAGDAILHITKIDTPPDLFIVSATAGDKHGIYIVRALRDMEWRSATKVIFYADTSDAVFLKEAERSADAVWRTPKPGMDLVTQALKDLRLVTN